MEQQSNTIGIKRNVIYYHDNLNIKFNQLENTKQLEGLISAWRGGGGGGGGGVAVSRPMLCLDTRLTCALQFRLKIFIFHQNECMGV